MTIDEYKQLDSVILAETNIKKLERVIGATEKGNLTLVFQDGEYFWQINDGIEPASDEAVVMTLDKFK